MMTGSAPPGLQRSYDRNVVWCRFWLTIGIAVATLSFTFMVEQGLHPILGTSSGAVEEPQRDPESIVSPGPDVVAEIFPEERIRWFDILAIFALILTSGSCILISYRFRLLYIKDDSVLQELERGNQQEATP